MTIRPATDRDVESLTNMNHQLVKDMVVAENWSHDVYRNRFGEWVAGAEWSVDLFEEDSDIVGYSVYQPRPDYYDETQMVIYIRQFFIERNHRRSGIGRSAFDHLFESRFPEHDGLALDVLSTNPEGMKFWEALGFDTYFTAMKKHPESPGSQD
jgi:GNAT superfamily N-acetyltransferase